MKENNIQLNQLPNNSVIQIEQQPLPAGEAGKQNNFLTILLSVLLFVSVAISGFFAFQTQRLVAELKVKNEELIVNSSESTIEPVATQASEDDSTANWKIYTNASLGFSLKYPSDVIIMKELNDEFNKSTWFKGDGLDFSVMIRKNTGTIDFNNYYYMDNNILRKSTLGGRVSNVYEMSKGYCDGTICGDPSITFVSEKESNLYHLIFTGDVKMSETESQILSSFKFLE